MGLPYSGHDVRLIEGEVAVRVGDPVIFLGYWRNPDATADKVRDGWLHTGDLATVDEGYFTFVGRTDDLISSAGHRIGPVEIEECLVGHPAVSLAAVIGIPDPVRRARLAAHEVPREIEFVRELPMTVSGKIRRNELRRLEAEQRPG